MKALTPDGIAWRAAQDISEGAYVNLGIGLPERVADFVPAGREVIFHSENGILGMGPKPCRTHADPDLINAGKKPVTILPGGAYLHHADSFALIRGGHINICMMGAYEVSATGDLSNWNTDNSNIAPSVGGAMDLAQGAQAVYILMRHTTKNGRPKILDQCSLPLTGRRVVKRIYTDLALIDVSADGLVVREIADGGTLAELQSITAAELRAAPDLDVLLAPDLSAS